MNFDLHPFFSRKVAISLSWLIEIYAIIDLVCRSKELKQLISG